VLSLPSYSKELAYILTALFNQGKAARADHGIPLARQLLELLLLRVGSGKLRADDYYKLRLYRGDIRFLEKRQYASNHALPHHLFGRWGIVAGDKLLTYSVLSDFGIAVPKIHAICHSLRAYRSCPALKTSAEVMAYLRGSASYPLIAKPVLGIYSKDVSLLQRYDASADSVALEGDGPCPVRELAEKFLSAGSGYLLQELLRPHQEIRKFIGDKICTLRVIILLEKSGPRLFMAVWKINLGGNVADNYWREGNLLAKLDQGSGEIVQCMTGLGPQHHIVERHPKTDKLLAGFRVPMYRKAVDLGLRASRAFPGVPMQAWDIAITDDGPIPLELNVAGSLFIPQLVSQQGIWCSPLRDFIETLRG
jgi:hypothetical protein